jgi:hypothetical protein
LGPTEFRARIYNGIAVEVVVTGLILLSLGGGLVVPNLFAVAASIGSEMDRSRLFELTKGAYFAGPLLSQLALEPIAKLGAPVAPISALGLMGGYSCFGVSLSCGVSDA